MTGLRVDFRYAPTLQRALVSDASVKIVQGPVESGKSVYSLFQLYYWGLTMPRCLDGIRRSRFLIHRTTEQELKRGIMRTAANFFADDVFGSPEGSMPAIHRFAFLDVEMEWEYIAFEQATESVLKKLRSTEYTGALINEGQFVDYTLFMEIWKRMGRYPAKPDPKSNKPNPQSCPAYDKKKRLVMDMNAPRTNDHWVLRMRGDVPLPADMEQSERRKYRKPEGWEFFVQPPVVLPKYDAAGEIVDFAINPLAENLPFQDKEQILTTVSTGDLDDVKRDYMNMTVQVRSGRPRYPKFSRALHVSKQKLTPVEGVPVIIGYDPGISGAATFWQKINGQWRCYREMIARGNENLNSAEKQGRFMLDVLASYFPWHKEAGVHCWGDPFGTFGMASAERTFFSIIGQMGLQFRPPAKRDSPTLRHQIGTKLVTRFEMAQPSLLLCPVGCPMLIDAFDGGAVMKVIKTNDGLHEKGELNKNSKYADPIEAAEYAFWGGGEDTSIVETPEEDRIPLRVTHTPNRNILRQARRSSLYAARRA